MSLIKIPEPTPSTEIDEEILEIFVEEVEEVLENIVTSFKDWKADPNDSESLTTLRRNFHTLKGSGRLVGATAIGELGWHFEDMLNKVINGTLSVSQDMLKLIEQVKTVLPNLVEQFQHSLPVTDDIILLISQANYLAETQSQSLAGFSQTSNTSQQKNVQPKPKPSITNSPPQKNKVEPFKNIPEKNEVPSLNTEVLDEHLELEMENIGGEKNELDTTDEIDDSQLGSIESELKLDGELSELKLDENNFSDSQLNPEELPELELEEENFSDSQLNPEEWPELELEEANFSESQLDTDDLSTTDLEMDYEEIPDEIELDTDELPQYDELNEQQLIDIFKQEAEQHLTSLKKTLSHMENHLPCPIETDMIRIFHTLNGSSRNVNFLTISNIAAPMEEYARALQEQQTVLSPDILAFYNEATHLIENLLHNHSVDKTQLQTLLTQVQASLESLSSKANKSPIDDDTHTFPIEDELDEADGGFKDIFLEEADGILENTQFLLERWQASPDDLALMQELYRDLHTLKGSANMVGITAVGELSHQLESILKRIVEGTAKSSHQLQDVIQNSVDELAAMVEAVRSGVEVELPIELINQIKPIANGNTQPQAIEIADDEIDNAIKRVLKEDKTESESLESSYHTAAPPSEEVISFLEDDAEELLSSIQSSLEHCKTSPNDLQLIEKLYRNVHTLKGSANQIGMDNDHQGVKSIGEFSHKLEDVLERIVKKTIQPNTQLQDIIQQGVDELDEMRQAILSGKRVEIEKPTTLIKQPQNALTGKLELPQVDRQSQPVSEPEPQSIEPPQTHLDPDEKIQVRASMIDKMTNLAGELSISRAHMEQQHSAIRNNIVEMGQTVTRLREQLRRLDIETETQILSHFGSSKSSEENSEGDNEEFDPLEMDRFSTMQQLSRALLETVNDLVNIQDALKMLTRQSETILIQQSRMGAELQDNIMRTRMVPFSNISPGLQRLARLTARELCKQTEFVINGEHIEFERNVLNRLKAPHEHMIRNAINYGIEDPKTRQQAGKSSVGKMTIDLFREGAELVVKFSDDGAGLDLSKIRQKAEEQGRIQPDTVVNDQELMQFILEPGFSTANKVSKIAGRGVGMDVAITEIKQLGGSLQIDSKAGEGTTFEIRLPVSLTISQALLVYVGDETMAIPMNHVEAVLRAPRAAVLSETDEVRHYEYMDKKYRVFHLGELLGFGKHAQVERPLIPTLLIRAGNRRVALLVDGIEGSKEIVVKPVGPQISAIKWIAGATILGDGRVIIILDMSAITRADTTQSVDIPQLTETIKEEEQTTNNTIMVVDDSITVRKVTARLLKRHGMEVMTAKDGLDAIAQLQDRIPNLMLLDIEMPRMDGYELATQVRNTPDWEHLPIIMITSRTGAKHRDKAEQIGVNRYLGKPFNENELLKNIQGLLAETRTTK
jgi:chemosensory pili system protein ChpA (sensor histidine kinase/response regulator)